MKVFRFKLSYEEVLMRIPLRCKDIYIGGDGFYRALIYPTERSDEEKHDRELIASLNILGNPLFNITSRGGKGYPGFCIQFNDSTSQFWGWCNWRDSDRQDSWLDRKIPEFKEYLYQKALDNLRIYMHYYIIAIAHPCYSPMTFEDFCWKPHDPWTGQTKLQEWSWKFKKELELL
jgi:hypothetical protein